MLRIRAPDKFKKALVGINKKRLGCTRTPEGVVFLNSPFRGDRQKHPQLKFDINVIYKQM
ncbi:MAG TPA: hypothetical protein VIK72_15925 [Clostridiaceae bacterium]